MDIVEEQVQAYNARDIERFLATYSPEVVNEDGQGNVRYKGHDQMRAIFGAMFAISPDLHARILTRIRIGLYVVDEEEVTGIRGSPEVIRAVAIYRVEGDKIVHVRMLQ